MTENAPATGRNMLATKLAAILGEIGKVEKTGENSFHNYKYVTEDALFWAVRQKLAENKIFIFTSTERQTVRIITDKDKEGVDRSWALTEVETLHTFVDGDTGETFSVKSQGQGADNGDKGGYKAITGAMKYFIYKCFLIPTDDDPEADPKTDQRAAIRQGLKDKTADQREPLDERPTKPSPAKPAGKTIEVPRAKSTQLRDKFLDGRWQEVEIHFGKNRGVPLGKLEDKQIDWYANEWQPKPYNGKITDDDEVLRAALDAYLYETP